MPRASNLRKFIREQRRRQPTGDSKEADVTIHAPKHRGYGRHRPPIHTAADFVQVKCGDGGLFAVPEHILHLSPVMMATFRGAGHFQERQSRCITFPMIPRHTMERVLQFCFLYYLESFAAMTHSPPPEEVSLDDDDDTGPPPLLVPLQFHIRANEAFDLFQTSHFLGIAPLFQLSSRMIADHISEVPSLQGLSTDLCRRLAELASATDLAQLELREDLSGLGVDTEPLWRKHLDDITYLVDASKITATLEQQSVPPVWSQQHAHIPSHIVQCLVRYCAARVQLAADMTVQRDKFTQFAYLVRALGPLVTSWHTVRTYQEEADQWIGLSDYLYHLRNTHTLDLSSVDFSQRDNVDALVRFLRGERGVQVLIFGDCGLSSQNARRVVEAVPPSLRTVQLSNSKLCNTDLQSMCQSLDAADSCVETVLLQSVTGLTCNSTPPKCSPLSPCPHPHSHPLHISLAFSSLPRIDIDENQHSILYLLPERTTSLDLTTCGIRTQLLSLHIPAIRALCRMKALCLANNRLNTVDLLHMLEYLAEDPALETLNMSSNFISCATFDYSEWFRAWQHMLANNTHLVRLQLGSNSMDSDAIVFIIRALHQHRASHSVRFASLPRVVLGDHVLLVRELKEAGVEVVFDPPLEY